MSMLDRSKTTQAERDVLREALLDYVARLNGVRPPATRNLAVGQKRWRGWQAKQLLAQIDDR